MSCNICIEKFNKTTRKQVQCDNCDIQVCASCVKKYILDNAETPHCMQCKRLFFDRDICHKLSRYFLDTALKQKRIDILFPKEVALMPMSMHLVEQAIHEEELVRTMLLMESKFEFAKRAETMSSMKQYVEEYDKLMEHLTYLKSNSPKKKQGIAQKCGRTDCRGYLKDWKCETCKTKTCSQCREPKAQQHKCNQQVLDNIRFVEENAKPCPGCAAWIYKASGCDQMWCTQCHTTFSWNTGKVETGHVHNPHFHEWVQNTRHLEDEVPLAFAAQQFLLQNPDVQPHSNFHYAACAVSEYALNPIFLQQAQALGDNSVLRVLYMRNMLTEKQFKESLYRRYMDRNVKKWIHQNAEQFFKTIMDILKQYNGNNDKILVSKLEKHRIDTNKLLRQVGRYCITRHYQLK